MKILYIEFYNFKSYYGSHKFGPFDDRISCIAGPNGSGKSNFIDAILFVFGFKSKKLRQHNLQDLIHHAGNMMAATSCQVSITLKCKKHNVVISRRISQKGYSYYYIDEARADFKKIRQLMLKHKIDVKISNYLMLQGEVQKLSVSSPFQLLQFIEHIAGSYKFIKRINHLSNRLKQQEEVFKCIKGYYQKEKVEILKLKQKSQKAVRWIDLKRKAFKFMETRYQFQYQQSQKNVAMREYEMKVLEEQMSNFSKNYFESIQNINQNIALNKHNLNSLKQLQQQKMRQIKSLEKQVTDKQKTCQSLENDLNQIREKKEDLEKQFNIAMNQSYNTSSYKSQVKQLQKQIASQFTSNQISQITHLLNHYESKQKEQRKRIELIENKNKLLNILEQQKQIKKLNHQQHLLSLKLKSQQLLEKIEKGENRVFQLNETKKSLDNQIKLSNKQSQANNNDSTKIKKAISQGKVKGIYNKLREQCYAENQYAVPFYSVCPHLDFYIADTMVHAQQFIEYVKNNDLGRVNVIVEQMIDTPQFNAIMNQKFDQKAIGVHRLFDFIKVDQKKFSKFVFWSIRNTLLVKNLEQGIKVSYGPIRRRSVTFEGQIIYESGLMSSGTKKIGCDLENLEARKLKTLEELKEVSDNISSYNTQLQQTKQQIATKQDQIKLFKLLTIQQIENIYCQIEGLKKDINQIAQKISRIQIKIAQSSKFSAEDLNKIKNTNSKIQQLKQKIRTIKDPKTIQRDFNFKIDSIKQKQQKQLMLLKQAENSLENSKVDESQKSNEIKKLKKQIQNVTAKIRSLETDRKMKQTTYNENRRFDTKPKRIQTIKLEISKIKNKINDSQNKLQKQNEQVKQYQQYSVSHIVSSQDQYSFEQKESFQQNIERERMGIQTWSTNYFKNKLNEISKSSLDFKSINQYIKKRKVFDETEREYNQKYLSLSLLKTNLSQLQEKRRQKFKKSFFDIKKQFSLIFEQLSGGGQAQILLNSQYNPFADGLFIKAKPFRKQWKKVELLSGGQKTITSLSLIFACNVAMKCPFYIVDEIDAALDIDKAQIVAQYIKYKMDSQFLMISLREQTYKKANVMIPVYKINNSTEGITVRVQPIIDAIKKKRALLKLEKEQSQSSQDKEKEIVSQEIKL